MWIAHFNNNASILKGDSIFVCNITIEELSNWFLGQLTRSADMNRYGIRGMTVKVYNNGPSQSGAASCRKNLNYIMPYFPGF